MAYLSFSSQTYSFDWNRIRALVMQYGKNRMFYAVLLRSFVKQYILSCIIK